MRDLASLEDAPTPTEQPAESSIDDDGLRDLRAIASAVYVAVTRDIDDPSGGDDPVTEVTDTESLKTYVESYLDGYEVTPASLAAAVGEGVALTGPTLQELISQASESGIDVEEFFADGEFDIEAGLAAAASFGADGAARELSVRERVFELLSRAGDDGTVIFIDPSHVYTTFSLPAPAVGRIVRSGLPATTPFIGWGRDRDSLRPDGSFKRGEGRQEIFWYGDAATILPVLRQVEPLGYVIEGGENGTAFRMVAADDASSTEPYELPKRDDLLTDRRAPGSASLRYATSWVEKTKRPKSDDDVLAVDEARSRFDAEATGDLFVFPAVAEGESPAWCMRLRPAKKTVVVTHFHDPSGSVARIVEFGFSPLYTNEIRRGSLFRDAVTDFVWPVDHANYAPKTRAERKIVLGHAGRVPTIVRDDRASGEQVTTKHRGASAGDWISYPEFGDWETVLDPRFGGVEGPAVVRRAGVDIAWERGVRDAWREELA